MGNEKVSYAQLKKAKEEEVITKQCNNRSEVEKFFLELYKIDNWKEVFEGIDIPDIREKGSTLQDVYPHYLYGTPNTEEYNNEQQSFIDLFSQVKAKADAINEESWSTLCS
jgi:hypothetical protein